jgi:hypothetical protein
MAGDFTDALRYAGDTPIAATLFELVAAGAAWRAARVRRMLAGAERHRFCVSYESERYLTIVVAGFAGAELVAQSAALTAATSGN